MHDQDDQALQRWLDAEATGADEAADASFRLLFRALPVRSPSPGFAARVMTVVSDASLRGPSWSEVWWARGTVAAAMAITGLVLAIQGPAALAAAGLAWLLRAFEVGARAADFVLTIFRHGLGVWAWLGDLGQVVSRVMLVPPVFVFVIANLVVAVVGVAALRRLLDRQEGVA